MQSNQHTTYTLYGYQTQNGFHYTTRTDGKHDIITDMITLLNNLHAYALTESDCIIATSYEEACQYVRTEIDSKIPIRSEKASRRSLHTLSRFQLRDDIQTLYDITYDHYRGKPLRLEIQDDIT